MADKRRLSLLERSSDGFTLIELVISIVIIAILALIMVPAISERVSEARIAAAKADLKQVYAGIALVKSTEDHVTVVEDYDAFMSMVAERAGIAENRIGQFTYQASNDTVYIYVHNIKDFINYNGYEYGTGGITDPVD